NGKTFATKKKPARPWATIGRAQGRSDMRYDARTTSILTSGCECVNPNGRCVHAPPLSRSLSQPGPQHERAEFNAEAQGRRDAKRRKNTTASPSFSLFCASAPLRLCVKFRVSRRIWARMLASEGVRPVTLKGVVHALKQSRTRRSMRTRH